MAVDHIVQAADVAFIDEEELAELETRFIDHAHTIAQEIERARKLFSPLLYQKTGRTGPGRH